MVSHWALISLGLTKGPPGFNKLQDGKTWVWLCMAEKKCSDP